ncbi:MAG: hypothetical protein J3K34DRAFT_422677 [Monoraphidium minutum]|nr:MAG: hypothetical protein J3K34DRAFT_422677 [Monoraphidium minutum]
MGLRFPGSGFWLCPAAGRATEVLVALPPGGDRVNACAGITPWSRAADLETEDDVSRRWRIPFYPYPVMSTFAEWSSFAHHFPHLLFDGLLRTLGGGLAPCAAAALRLPECAVSDRCSAAVRPEGDTRCRSCADDATCTVYWGLEGHRCDNRPNWSRSGLCYRPPSPLLPFSVPPTLLGLFYDKSRPGGAGARFDAPPRGADGGRRMAPGGEEAGARVQAS